MAAAACASTSVPAARAGADELEQRAGPGHRRRLHGRIGAALEAHRRLGAQAEALGGRAHRLRLEPRALEDDARRAVADLGVGAAHHAADARWRGRRRR